MAAVAHSIECWSLLTRRAAPRTHHADVMSPGPPPTSCTEQVLQQCHRVQDPQESQGKGAKTAEVRKCREEKAPSNATAVEMGAEQT